MDRLGSSGRGSDRSRVRNGVCGGVVNFLGKSTGNILTLSTRNTEMLSFEREDVPFAPSFVDFLGSIISPSSLLSIRLESQARGGSRLVGMRKRLSMLGRALRGVRSRPCGVAMDDTPTAVSNRRNIGPANAALALRYGANGDDVEDVGFTSSNLFA